MREFPEGGLIGKVYHTVRALSRLRVGLYAAHACYFIILSMFPALVLLLSLLRYTGLEAGSLLTVLEGFIPQALLPAVEKVVMSTYRNTSGVVVSVSAVTALWSASRGMYGLLTGLNAVYQVTESRGYLYTRAVSVGYMFAFLVVLLLTLLLNVFGGTILKAISGNSSLFRFLNDVLDLRFILLLALQTGLFSAMFMALPNASVRFGEAFPGALLAALGWQVFSGVYSRYVESLGNYENVYGSVYSVALSMLWLYFCISIVFYGGALNRFFARQ